jgi:hypothetical protein
MSGYRTADPERMKRDVMRRARRTVQTEHGEPMLSTMGSTAKYETHGIHEIHGDRGTHSRFGVTKRASEIEVRSVEYLWRPYLPRGRVVILDGTPDVGKSLLTIDIAAREVMGNPFPLATNGREPGCALIVNLEDVDHDTIVPRLMAAGCTPDALGRVHIWKGVFDNDEGDIEGGFTIGKDAEELADIIRQNAITLLIVDPLMAAISDKVDTKTDHHTRRELAKLHRLAEATGVTVIVVRHVTKGAGLGSAMNAGAGSTGIIGAARSGLVVGRDKDDRSIRHLAVVKQNLVPDDERPSLRYTVKSVPVEGAGEQPKIEWIGVSAVTADELVGSLGERPEDAEARRDIEQWLSEFLGQRERAAKEVFEAGRRAGGWNEQQLRRGLTRIGGTHRREGFGAGAQYIWMPKHAAPVNDPALVASPNALTVL